MDTDKLRQVHMDWIGLGHEHQRSSSPTRWTKQVHLEEVGQERIQDPELHYLMVTAAKAAPNLHIPNQSFFVSTRSSSRPFLIGSSTTCV
ncbi:hypothetical protein llap_1059 [Limosa lapponica baueri]|uniref:Uncharacterized protein n=1 Tax=Limosa lapponica baueri TaxID=1758121 RepID=A0A2I0URD7_LIMLA|nr:hypothetical protein llap_1059 [Limosa lapponica baueri]